MSRCPATTSSFEIERKLFVVTDGEEEDFLAGECLKFGISIDLAQRAALMIATATQAANPVYRQSHPGRSPQQLRRSFLEALFPLHFSV
jgi:hypothetical protein